MIPLPQGDTVVDASIASYAFEQIDGIHEAAGLTPTGCISSAVPPIISAA